MPLGYPATGSRSRGRWSSALLVFLLWVAYQVGVHLALSRPAHHQNQVVVYERLIAAMALAGLHSEQVPDWALPMTSTTREGWIEGIDEYVEAALAQEDFPPDAFADWALAHFLLGDESRALEILERAEAAGVSTSEPEFRLVIDYITGEMAEPDTGLRHWAQDSYAQGTAGWPVWHVLSEMPSADIDREWLAQWLEDRGLRMVRQGSLATAMLYLVMALGVICVGALLCARRKIPAPLPEYRLPTAWNLALLTRLFFLSLLVSSVGAMLAWDSLSSAGMFTPGMVVAYLLSQLLPVIWLVGKLTPGCDALTRLFGLYASPHQRLFPLTWALVMAIAVAGGVIAVEELLVRVVPDFSWSHEPGDWLRFEMLDSAARRGIGLLVAVVLAPLCEEIVFRGFLFGALRTKTPTLAAAVVSSALFATVHWYSLVGWCMVFLMGLLFCWLFHRTNSLWPAILAHGLYNFAVVFYVQAWFSF